MPKQMLIYEVVLDEIKRRIADAELRPGQRLPSNQQLSKELHVGISSVREALRVLASAGVVRIAQGSGVFVSPQPPPPDELRKRFTTTEVASLGHLMEARRIIEPELAALAAERASLDQVRRIEDYAERMNRNFRAGRDWMEADLGFHAAIYEAANNPDGGVPDSDLISSSADLSALNCSSGPLMASRYSASTGARSAQRSRAS